ncbi:MAG: hypothetical protein K2K66_00110 [Ruminococcus sp.]|nr:hypothetical protein [Ruminococcus sp.]
MKTKILALVAVLCLGIVSCSNKPEENSYSSPEESSEVVNPTLEAEESLDEVMKIPDSAEAMKNNFAGVPSVDEGPVISIGNTTVKAGEIAEVKVYVEGADFNWNNCGIHLTYPDVLKCVYEDNDDLFLKYEKGEASENHIGIVAMEWKKENNPPEELTAQNLGTMFFTVMFNGNEGQDGEILTLYLKVPEDAESGTVYPVDFYYLGTDMFRNAENNLSFEKYAFEHTQAGTITVE